MRCVGYLKRSNSASFLDDVWEALCDGVVPFAISERRDIRRFHDSDLDWEEPPLPHTPPHAQDSLWR